MKHLAVILFLLGVLAPFHKMAARADLPRLSTKAFIAKYLVIDQEKGTSRYGIEKYDTTKNKASLTIVDGDKAVLVIMDYADQLVASIEYSASTNIATACSVLPMSFVESGAATNKDNFHFFGGFEKVLSTNVPKLFTPKYIFSLNNSKSFVKKDPTTIDGVAVDHWSSDMEWPSDTDKFTVDYYFTREEDNWKPAQSVDTKTSQLSVPVYPVRIAVTGTKQKPAGRINRIYDYLDFKMSDQLPNDAFDFPEGTECKSKLATTLKPMPTIPDTVSYMRERIDANGNVNIESVYHDRSAGLMEINYKSKSVFYDFNDGVVYTSNRYTGCSVRAIDSSLDKHAQDSGQYVDDIGPLEFWFLNKEQTYEGVRTTRLFESSSWGGNIDKQMFDVHFASMDWHFLSQSPESTNPVPLSMVRNGVRYNFFNFKETASHLRNDYQVSRCRLIKGPSMMGLIFHADVSGSYYYPEVTKDDLVTDDGIASFVDSIAKVAQVSPLQVKITPYNAVWDKDEGLFTLPVTLYEQLSPKRLYRRQNKTSAGSSNAAQTKSVQLTLKDGDQAANKGASLCNGNSLSDKFECRSFDLCKNKDGSFIVKMHLSLPATTKPATSTSCDYFSRSVDSKPSVSLTQALTNVQDAVERGSLAVNITLNKNIGTTYLKTFTAIETKNKNSYVKHDYEGPMQKFWFRRKFNAIIKRETVAGKITTPEDCASTCLGRNEYKCIAFQYCYWTQQCFLSDKVPINNSTAKISGCWIYQRLYLGDFSYVKGQTVPAQNRYQVKNTLNTADGCARKCESRTDFTCESFDFCKDTGTCFLSKTHFYSLSSDKITNSSARCYHFSKNYILDYTVTEKTSLKTSDSIKYQTISVSNAAQCAYLCRTGYDGQGCVQFEYCHPSRQCRIVGDIASKNNAAYIGSPTCNVFTLKNAPSVSVSSRQTGSDSDKTYSDASFAGLAIAMTVIGLAIGGLIMVVLYRKNALNKFV